MNTLEEKLKNKGYKPTSINTYIRNINNILKLLGIKKEDFKDFNFLNDINKIMNLLKDKKDSTIRNYLTSIYTILNIIDNKELSKKYKEKADELNNKEVEKRNNFEKNESQQKNWVSLKDLKKEIDNNKKIINALGLIKKPRLNKKEFDIFINWVVSNLYLGDEMNPPRRLDYNNMEILTEDEFNKLKEQDKNNKNFLIITDKKLKHFLFCEYKTSSKFGCQKLKVGNNLNNVLNIWIKRNPSKKYLLPLFNNDEKHITPEQLARIIIRSFKGTGKNISSNMLRHIYITEKFGKPDNNRLSVADKMGHSLSSQLTYSKI